MESNANSAIWEGNAAERQKWIVVCRMHHYRGGGMAKRHNGNSNGEYKKERKKKKKEQQYARNGKNNGVKRKEKEKVQTDKTDRQADRERKTIKGTKSGCLDGILQHVCKCE